MFGHWDTQLKSPCLGLRVNAAVPLISGSTPQMPVCTLQTKPNRPRYVVLTVRMYETDDGFVEAASCTCDSARGETLTHLAARINTTTAGKLSKRYSATVMQHSRKCQLLCPF